MRARESDGLPRLRPPIEGTRFCRNDAASFCRQGGWHTRRAQAAVFLRSLSLFFSFFFFFLFFISVSFFLFFFFVCFLFFVTPLPKTWMLPMRESPSSADSCRSILSLERNRRTHRHIEDIDPNWKSLAPLYGSPEKQLRARTLSANK